MTRMLDDRDVVGTGEACWSSDGEDCGGVQQHLDVMTDPEVWQDHWSEELVTLWHGLKDHADAMGAAGVLARCDFHAFATFCYEHSDKRPPVC